MDHVYPFYQNTFLLLGPYHVRTVRIPLPYISRIPQYRTSTVSNIIVIPHYRTSVCSACTVHRVSLPHYSSTSYHITYRTHT